MITKGEIDRLGNQIRSESEPLTEKTLIALQDYRTSHKEILSATFDILCKKAKLIHHSAIVTYRIKRIESIIGKLVRFPEMRFSRMWDIGGCRCILRNNDDIYKLRNLIVKETNIQVVKEYNYLSSPKEDGYRSLHLFLKHTDGDNIIEVQLRNQVDHNWATLVEITDLLFDTKLKECADNSSLGRFHFLLSKTNTLDIDHKKEISSIINEHNYFERLSEVFARNYIKVRKQWIDIESKTSHKFFLIETTKDDVPKIEAFKSFYNAEAAYLNVYKTRQNANIVLTHLQSPSYNQISIAYSNYILTFHSFITDCCDIIESLIIDSMEKGEYHQYLKMYTLYHNLSYHRLKNLLTDVAEIREYSENPINKKPKNKSKYKEWIDDINSQVKDINDRSNLLKEKYRKSLPTGWLKKKIIIFISTSISNRYKIKNQKLLTEFTLKTKAL